MLYPSIDKILNVVDSKYRLANVAAKRSKQIMETKHTQMPSNTYKSKKEIGMALEEIEKGLIKIVD